MAGDAALAGVGGDQRRQDAARSSSCRRRWGRAGRRPCPRRPSRSMPSSTTCSPKDLRSPRVLTAGAVGLIVTGHSLSEVGRVGKLAGGAQRLPVALPLLLEDREPFHQEVRERRPLQQDRPPLAPALRPAAPGLRGPARPAPGIRSCRSPSTAATVRSIRTRSIRSPAARKRRIRPRLSKALTAPAIALRLASSASASSAMLCSRRVTDRQVTQQAPDHREPSRSGARRAGQRGRRR